MPSYNNDRHQPVHSTEVHPHNDWFAKDIHKVGDLNRDNASVSKQGHINRSKSKKHCLPATVTLLPTRIERAHNQITCRSDQDG